MIGRFLIDSQDSNDKISPATGLQQALLRILRLKRGKERFRIEAAYHLHLILTLAHHQLKPGGLSGIDTEFREAGKHTSACQAGSGYQKVIAGIQHRTFLQQAAPGSAAAHIEITLIVRQQLQPTLRSHFRKGEMRVIFRIVQRLDRRIFSNQPAFLRNKFLHKYSILTVQVHIQRTLFFHQLHLARHLVYTCRYAHAARHGYKENIAAVCICQPCPPHTFGRYGITAQIAMLIHADVPCYPLHQLHRLRYISLRIFL